ncbi:DNA pilot protein [Microvirus D_HF4_274]|nr:DNA pilot protein [Microvirus D_HF4_274]
MWIKKIICPEGDLKKNLKLCYMPLPVPEIISGGAGVLSAGIDWLAQSDANRKSREFQEKMYDRQRADALADWNRQNEYNSPVAARARLESAHLKHGLMYGGGLGSLQGGQIRSSSPGQYSPRAPQVDLQGIVGNVMQTKYQNAQIGALEKINSVRDEEILLKKAQTAAALAGIDKTKISTASQEFDLAMRMSLADYAAESKRLQVEKQKADLSFTLDENRRKEVATSVNVFNAMLNLLNYDLRSAKNAADIAKINEEINNLKKDGRIKEFSAKMADRGLDPRTPWYLKLVTDLYNAFKRGDKTLPYLSGDEIDSFGRPR